MMLVLIVVGTVCERWREKHAKVSFRIFVQNTLADQMSVILVLINCTCTWN